MVKRSCLLINLVKLNIWGLRPMQIYKGVKPNPYTLTVSIG
jgi:hypothetical protein